MTSNRIITWRCAAFVVALAITAVVTSSCRGKPDEKEASGKGRTSSAAGESRFLGELTKETFEKTDAPSAAPVFRWDFSRKGVLSYGYEQEVHARTGMGGLSEETGEVGQTLTGKGKLLVSSQGGGTANLVLKDMRVSMKINLGKGKKPETVEQTFPPLVVQGMKEDGSAALGNSSQEMFLRTLFPLPPRELAPGESVDVPAHMPFNAMGSPLHVTGRYRITLADYVDIGGRTCAQLDTDIDISELTIPEELEGEYRASVTGRSVFFFDVESRCFVSGTVALLMEMSVDAPTPKVTFPEDKQHDLPKRVTMSMVSDNLVRITLDQ